MDVKLGKQNCFNFTVAERLVILRKVLENEGNPQLWSEASEAVRIISYLMCFKIDRLHKEVYSAFGITCRLYDDDAEDTTIDRLRVTFT